MRLLLLALAMLLPLTLPAKAETRGVIELFTSQGCSSCPPADKLVETLAAKPGLIVLSLPVDYWDYLGWKDTLASPAHTKRQKAYAQARGDRNIYTPQIVVNGLVHVVGSKREAVDLALRTTAEDAGVLSVPVVIRETADGYAIEIGAGGPPAEVWLMPIETSVAVEIGRGENSGHAVTYTNVVRGMARIGAYAGIGETLAVTRARASIGQTDGFAVLVQSVDHGLPRAILGAALHQPKRSASN